MGIAVDASIQNGTFWLSNNNVWVRSGGLSRNLSDAGGGTIVVANPSGSSGSDLARITIDGTNYNIPSGSGSGITSLVAGAGISVTGSGSSRTIALNVNNIPAIRPSSTNNDLGSTSQYWRTLYVRHILPRGSTKNLGSTSNIWSTVYSGAVSLYSGTSYRSRLSAHSSGLTLAVSGNLTFSVTGTISGLPDTGGGTTVISAGSGISVTGAATNRTVSLNAGNLPTLLPGNLANDLGSSGQPLGPSLHGSYLPNQ